MDYLRYYKWLLITTTVNNIPPLRFDIHIKNRAWSPPLPFPPSHFYINVSHFLHPRWLPKKNKKKLCARGRGGGGGGGIGGGPL